MSARGREGGGSPKVCQVLVKSTKGYVRGKGRGSGDFFFLLGRVSVV